MKDRFGLVMLVVIVFLAGFWASSWVGGETTSAKMHKALDLDKAQMDSFRVAASWSANAYDNRVRKLTEEEVALYVSLIEVIKHPCLMPTWKIKQMVTDNVLKMALVSVAEMHRAQGDTAKR